MFIPVLPARSCNVRCQSLENERFRNPLVEFPEEGISFQSLFPLRKVNYAS